MDFYAWVRAQWDRAAAVAALVVGIIALIIGWAGVSGVTLPTEQIPYLISGGLVGVFALGIAGTLWLSADLRDEWRKLDQIHQALTGLAGSKDADRPAPAQAAADTHVLPAVRTTPAHAPGASAEAAR